MAGQELRLKSQDILTEVHFLKSVYDPGFSLLS
jgi:hypothetical protein